MKYTNYILHGDVINIEQLISEKPVWKQLTIMGLLPVAIFGVVFFTGTLPFTVMIDGYRYLKMRYYVYMKKYRRYKYYEEAFTSLAIPRSNKETLKILFTKGREMIMNSSAGFEEISHLPFKMRLEYMLMKSSYVLVDQRINAYRGIDRGFGYVKRTLSYLEPR